MPVILRLRQPPPSTTARQANPFPLAKLRWQKTFHPAAVVSFAPSGEQARPGTGAAGLSGARLTGEMADAADTVIVGGGFDGGFGAGFELAVAAMVIVVTGNRAVRLDGLMLSGPEVAVVGGAGSESRLEGLTGRVCDGRCGATEETAAAGTLPGAGRVVHSSGELSEDVPPAPALNAGRVATAEDRAQSVLCSAETECDLAMPPMVITAPTSTPTVTLSTAAVTATPVRRPTAPAFSSAHCAYFLGVPRRPLSRRSAARSASLRRTVTHGYRSAVPRRSHRPLHSMAERFPDAASRQIQRSTPDGEFLVRTVPGTGATKPYRCPGCQHVIPPGTAHLVVWPVWTGADDGVGHRRHWHTGCWNRRAARGGPGQLSW